MSTTPTPPSLVYTREELAAALGMSMSSFERLRKSDATMPAPIRFAGPRDRPKWPRAAVEAWLEAKTLEQEAGGPQ